MRLRGKIPAGVNNGEGVAPPQMDVQLPNFETWARVLSDVRNLINDKHNRQWDVACFHTP